MTPYQERLHSAIEIERELNDPLRTFEVVLRVTTRASTWGDGGVDKGKMFFHFEDYLSEICETANLVDDGDSIIVHKVTEVTNDYDT